MKKVLFATSALVMTAGVAAAEVTLSGDARMGVVYDGDNAQFGSRARVKFTLSGETDTGLSFGASFRADQASGSTDGVKGAVWVSGTYGKLSMGDVVSASEAAIGDLYSVGYTEGTFLGDMEEISYLTGDGANTDQGPNVLYEYSINGFNLYGSMSDGDTADWPGAHGEDAPVFADGKFQPADNNAKTAWSLGASYMGEYTGGTWKVGLGFAQQKFDDGVDTKKAREIVVGGEMTYGAFSGKAFYADYKNRNGIYFNIDDGEDEFTLFSSNYEYDKGYGLSLAYEYDAFIFKGFYRRDEIDAVVAAEDDFNINSWGVGVDYDLGGGAVLAAGVGNSNLIKDTVADAGIRFKF